MVKDDISFLYNNEIKWFTQEKLNSATIKPDFTKEILLEQVHELKWMVNDETSSNSI